MKVENVPDYVWNDLVLGKTNAEFDFLALKILLSRLRQKIHIEPSPEVIQEAIDELKALFIRFGNLPSAQKDFEKILVNRSIS